jgi:hypothetical protein
MKLLRFKKIVLLILSLIIVLSVAFVAVKYFGSRKIQFQNAVLQSQTPGTCSPSPACKGNPELCMTSNLNKVCE